MSRRDFPSGRMDQFVLRLPDGMRAAIKIRAAINHRTMNSEIVHYLDRALAAEEESGAAEGATSPRLDLSSRRETEGADHA